MLKNIKYFTFLFGLFALTSCSLSKSLPEGAYLYGGAKVKIKKTEKGAKADVLEPIFEEIIANPEANGKFLGVRWGLRFYNLFYTEKKKGAKAWLQRKLGEAPVIYSDAVTGQVEKLMKNKAFNNGFFDAKVRSEVRKKKRIATVKYIVKINEAYQVDSIFNRVKIPDIQRIISASNKKTLVKTGEPFDLTSLKIERERLTGALRKNGYYHFRDDFLLFKADTTKSGDRIHLELELKEGVDSLKLLPQRINRITIISDYTDPDIETPARDTVLFEGLRIIYRKSGVKAEVLRKAIAFEEGELYSIEKHAQSLKQLSQLPTFQFTNIRFEQSRRSDTLMNAIVRLTPRKRESVEGSIGAALKQQLFFGPEISISYVNRNLFRGAEEFRLTAFGNYNFPLQDNLASQQETGATAQLSQPGLLTPFRADSRFGKIVNSKNLIGKTRASFTFKNQQIRFPILDSKSFLEEEGFTELSRQLAADSTFTPFVAFENYDFSWTYSWRSRPDKQYEFTPLNVILQTPRFEVEELKEFLTLMSIEQQAVGLLFNLERMLVLKPAYIFTYDSRLKKVEEQNFYYRGKAAVSGNFLLSENDIIPREFLESRIFQIENDARWFWNPSSRQTFGVRAAANVLFPIGSQISIPFFDRYTVGGPNSVRAFSPRRIGPGTVEPTDETLLFAGTGDIQLEGSFEWRPKITDLIELGVFIDAGNVWNYNAGFAENFEGAFEFSDFYKELAVGTGLGLRLNFEILVLRADFAFPLTKPWLPESQRWVGDQIQLGSGKWLTENVTFNLAFGYPF